MDNAKAFFEQIKVKLQPLKEVVFYNPLSAPEVAHLEKEWNIKMKPVLREFLLTFGFYQDVVEKLRMNKEYSQDNLYWLNKLNLSHFFPIDFRAEIGNCKILALNLKEEGDYLYTLKFDMKENLKEIVQKKKTFTEVINKAVDKIDVKKRAKNVNKMKVVEFELEDPKPEEILLALKEADIKQLTNWRDKHYLEDFSPQIARFELFNKITIVIEKDICKYCRFKIEEPVLVDKQNSPIYKINKILEKSQLTYEVMDYDIVAVG